jgi:carboxyl-terminal processing protease
MVFVASLLASTASAADALEPKPYAPEIANLVVSMLEELHYEKKELNDDLSEVWFDVWLDTLDYQRMYLLADDVKRFDSWRTRLDDAVGGQPADLSVATDMFRLTQQRVKERSAFALSVLDEGVDITDEEMWVPNRHDAGTPWASSTDELDRVWRQRVEHDLIAGLLVDCGADKPECFDERKGEVVERLRKRYERYGKNYDEMDSIDVLEMFLGALSSTYDPHSTWFAPARNDNFDIEITNSVEGIGAQLRVRDDYTTVEKVIEGGPAAKNGELQPGDRIIAVAQGDEEPVDVVGWRIDKVVKLIRGPKGTEVRLLVHPADAKDPSVVAEIRLERDRVDLEESAASLEMRQVEGRQIAVLDVPSFYLGATRLEPGVAGDVKELLLEAKAKGAEGVVLDLSRNGGGSLREAVDLAGLFITTGPVVQIRDRDSKVSPLHDPDRRQVWSGPLVVLTSQISASASEIVAGALQDYDRAVIVGGAQTHGKGTVQQVADLTRMMRGARGYDEQVGGALKLTIQKFYRISGHSTQRKGVVPDIILPTPYDGLDVLEGDLDHALVWDEIPMLPHAKAEGFDDVLPKLREASTRRVTASEDFQELAEQIAERERREADPQVSLNLEARRLELLAFQKEEEEEEEEGEEEVVGGKTPTYLLDEAVHVLADLIELRST